MKNIIAIDPGAAGGIAILRAGLIPETYNMPSTNADIRDLLEELEPTNTIIYCERVGTYMPGNSGPSAAKFAEHVGALKGIICALRTPVIFPTPAAWIHDFIGKPNYVEKKADYEAKAWKQILAKRKNERKNKIKARAQEMFPHLKVTLKTADALGILQYGIQNQKDLIL